MYDDRKRLALADQDGNAHAAGRLHHAGRCCRKGLSPIHGSWQGTHTPCRQVSDDTWQIDATGASAYESSCRVRSVTRQGNRFTLRQRCQYFEEFANETTVFRLVNRNELEIEGRRYRRCGR